MNKETLEKANELLERIQKLQEVINELQKGLDSKSGGYWSGANPGVVISCNEDSYVHVSINLPGSQECLINMPVKDMEQGIMKYLKEKLHLYIMEFEKL